MSKENEILWLTYNLFCHNRGLAEGKLKTLEEFMIYRKDFYKEVLKWEILKKRF